MAISDELDLTLQTKEGLKGVIEDNGQTAPTKFSQYPAVLDNIIDNMRDQLKIADFIIINDNTTLASLNSFFEFLPSVPAGSTTTTQATAEVITSNLNVRTSGSASGSYAGLLVKG